MFDGDRAVAVSHPRGLNRTADGTLTTHQQLGTTPVATNFEIAAGGFAADTQGVRRASHTAEGQAVRCGEGRSGRRASGP